jgi:hypothetical protein
MAPEGLDRRVHLVPAADEGRAMERPALGADGDRGGAGSGRGARLGGDGDREGRPRRCSGLDARRIQAGVLEEHGLLQVAQLRAGLEPQLLGQHLAHLVVGAERVRLPPVSVQRDHAVRPQPLLERVLADECRELAHQLLVVARAEVGGDALVQRSEAHCVQAGRLGDGEGRAPHVGQGVAPPEGERGGEGGRRRVGTAGFDRGPAPVAVIVTIPWYEPTASVAVE